jgi:hypothetical protein
MIRRLVLLALLAAVAFLIYSNRHQIAIIAGLDSNRIRIQGDWQEVQSGIKEYDVYTFDNDMVERNGEPCGQYRFRGYSILEVSIDGRKVTYSVEFPDSDNMNWYQEVKGEQKLRRQWRR